MRMTLLRDWGWVLVLAVLLAVPLAIRGPMPPDELRYLAVAWEMWTRGDLIVPYLNGAPYADKPPVLFWFMHAGWAVFGVNEWWPRLLPGLFACTAILMTRRLCRVLWPDDADAARLAPWLLLGTFAWVLYTQILMFDLLLVNWVLLGLLGLAGAARGDGRGWYLVAAATAFGLLTKGPVILLHLAGPGLLAPWWVASERFQTRPWYGRLGLALLGGGLVALLWALAALWRGGADYGSELLLGQTAGRLVESFAHARPFWYYLWVLPLLLFPWSFWPTLWRDVKSALPQGLKQRGGWRLMLAASLPALAVFCLISGKQPHYLLPLIPPLTLLAAVSLSARSKEQTGADLALIPAVLTAAIAAVGAYLPRLPFGNDLDVAAWAPGWGIAAAVLILPLGLSGARRGVVKRLALIVPLLVVSAETAFFNANAQAYDTAEAAKRVSELRQAGHPVAYAGTYNGELNFPGRLTRPLPVIDNDKKALRNWAVHHPDGYLIEAPDQKPDSAFYTQPLRGGWLTIRPASDYGTGFTE